MDNAVKLRKLMDEHSLARADVARLTSSSKSAVDSWLAPRRAKWHREMPDNKLELLHLKLSGR